MKKRFSLLVLLVLCAGLATTAPAQGQGAGLLPETAWSYDTEAISLNQFLDALALSFGVELRKENLPASQVAGQSRAPSGRALLDRLAEEHGFDWYRDGALLIVSGQSLRGVRSYTFADGTIKARFLEAARRRTTPAYGLDFDASGSNPNEATLRGPCFVACPVRWVVCGLDCWRGANCASDNGAGFCGREYRVW